MLNKITSLTVHDVVDATRLFCATCRQTVARLQMNLIKGSYLALQSGSRAYIVD